MSLEVGTLGTSKPKSAQISAVVIRADGTREDLGTIAYYHKNPLRQFAWDAGQKFKRLGAAISSLLRSH